MVIYIKSLIYIYNIQGLKIKFTKSEDNHEKLDFEVKIRTPYTSVVHKFILEKSPIIQVFQFLKSIFNYRHQSHPNKQQEFP